MYIKLDINILRLLVFIDALFVNNKDLLLWGREEALGKIRRNKYKFYLI